MVDPPSTVPNQRSVVALIGVYDADGTLAGEVGYWVRARLGRAHCALCDITHGSVRAKPEWSACRDALSIRFDTYHRDDMPDDVRAVVESHLPAVVAEVADGSLVLLLGPKDLEACGGSLDAMLDKLTTAATARSLQLDLGLP